MRTTLITIALAALLAPPAIAQEQTPPESTPVPARDASAAKPVLVVPARLKALREGKPAPPAPNTPVLLGRVRIWDLDATAGRESLLWAVDDTMPAPADVKSDGRTLYQTVHPGTRRVQVGREATALDSADFELGLGNYTILSQPLQDLDSPNKFPSRLLSDTFKTPAEGKAAVRLLVLDTPEPLALIAGTRTVLPQVARESHTGFHLFDPATEPLAIKLGSEVIVLDGSATKPEAGNGYSVLVRSAKLDEGGSVTMEWVLLPEGSGVADPDDPHGIHLSSEQQEAEATTAAEIRKMREQRARGLVERRRQLERPEGGRRLPPQQPEATPAQP